MIRKVFLYGMLEDKYGRGPIEITADNMPQLLSGLNSNLSEFRKHFNEVKEYVVVKSVEGRKKALVQEEVGMTFGNIEEFHFIPSIEGSGIEIAVALLGAAASTTAVIVVGTVINIAIAFAVSTLAGMLAPSPSSSTSGSGRPEDQQSFIFSGPMNVVEQGGPVPLVYGEFRTGSTVISVGVTTEGAPITNVTPGTPPPPPSGGGGGNSGGDGGTTTEILEYTFPWPYYSMDITSGFHIGDTLRIHFTTGSTIKDGSNIAAAEYGTPAVTRVAGLYSDEACTNLVAGSRANGNSVMTLFGPMNGLAPSKLQPNTDYWWKMQAWSIDLADWSAPVGNTDGIRVSINAA